ncbi:MAG: hypothetical protein QOD26_3889 [Betaproteobacteria bacterium]|jgi:hypothetical protein|nr:hypothetical protein [Betaproteobacteria bacterium]
MKITLGLIGIVAIVWLGLWLSNTGLLVHSGDTRIPKTRECSYVIGVTVVRKIEPLADRCPLMRTVGP